MILWLVDFLFSDDDSDIMVFRENSQKFRLFGTGIHVNLGATVAATIGLIVTIIFCVIYTFYHNRGQGRNEFIDHLELGLFPYISHKRMMTN